ncbi:uncharacterized protein EV420DRAFT_110267 [Desarmillaria tabescens]|uniref:Uncharacterized protein n=1 Tax=Armillaria tabescens TaxID=1929756 RepID=A0AA39U9A9_ARMTA|nr:uncharacterized protein EV420DRAFT_110267 [Desarmillaria tabescens]KAK0470370.1 hypothetical protein EV420DRAFT_110267 [Desarmillaria tabescens]
MGTIFPSNIQDFLTFLPIAPQPGPDPWIETSTTAYTAHNILTPPADRPLLSRPDPNFVPRLTEFLNSRVAELGISDVSCQSMLQGLELMRILELEDENTVNEYGEYVTRAIDPIVRTIANAANLGGRFNLLRGHVKKFEYSSKSDFTITFVRKNEQGIERTATCSDEDLAYSVLLSKAEELSRPICLDATKRQEGAAAMAVKLALQMITSRVEYGFLFGGFIAIAAQLVRSTDVSRPGHILLLSPAFKLFRAPLVHPDPNKALNQFQANIQPQPFLAIVVAMIISKLIPGRRVADPPSNLLRPQLLETIQDAEEGEQGDEEGGHDGDEVYQSGLPNVLLQVSTNTMTLQHPWLRSSDIHRISVSQHPVQPSVDIQNTPTASSDSGFVMKSFPLSLLPQPSLLQLCRSAPRILSTSPDVVTLVSQIRASRWSTVWEDRADDREELFIIKLVPDAHTNMIWREFYMYEVVLKECSLVPRFYGMFQRPVGGWFAFCLEDVGDWRKRMA